MAAASGTVVATASGEVVTAVSGEASTTLLAKGIGWIMDGDSYPVEDETGGMTMTMEEDGAGEPVPAVPVPIGAVVVPLP